MSAKKLQCFDDIILLYLGFFFLFIVAIHIDNLSNISHTQFRWDVVFEDML